MTYHFIHLIHKPPDYPWTFKGHGGLIILNADYTVPAVWAQASSLVLIEGDPLEGSEGDKV